MASRDHAHSITDEQGNPTLAASGSALVELRAAANASLKRRLDAKEGCGNCPYCELGAVEHCRHYDLMLEVWAAEDAIGNCRACRGYGVVGLNSNPCSVCDGTGRDPSPPVTSDAVPGTNPSNPKGQDQ